MQLYMATVTSSTCVTVYPDISLNNVPCDIADRKMCNSQMSCRWFSGRIPACHAGDPGSIPGTMQTLFSHLRPVKYA